MSDFRPFNVRLDEFIKLTGYTLIADTLDYIVIETSDSKRFQCSGYSVHLAMLEAGIY